jgi:hypothetical protein
VLLLKKERQKEQKKLQQFKKNLAAETKEGTKGKKREEKSEYSCSCSKLISFILCDYIFVQAHVSKQGLA